jgi:hypothetical protein
MKDDAIPQWALDEAHKRLTAEGRWREPTNHATKVLASMIVKHEQPPVDPDEEALKRILSCVLMFVRNDELFRAALTQYKKEIGRG